MAAQRGADIVVEKAMHNLGFVATRATNPRDRDLAEIAAIQVRKACLSVNMTPLFREPDPFTDGPEAA
jgi:hypothetical protein